MARLVYSMITSLDGYVEAADGDIDWGAPDDEVHSFVNDLQRPIGTYLYGRRMYETMVYWETAHEVPGQPAVALDYAEIWRRADKIVYSKTLDRPTSARTRIERDFLPEVVRQMKTSVERDITVAGPELAAAAIRAGLVDELQLFVTPIVLGAGKPAFQGGVRLSLELTEQRRFTAGTVFLRYVSS